MLDDRKTKTILIIATDTLTITQIYKKSDGSNSHLTLTIKDLYDLGIINKIYKSRVCHISLTKIGLELYNLLARANNILISCEKEKKIKLEMRLKENEKDEKDEKKL